MICFRVGDIKSATVSSQLTKMKTAKMKKMQVVNLLFLPFSCGWAQYRVGTVQWAQFRGHNNAWSQ